MPSSSVRMTSEATPWIVDVIGAMVTLDKKRSDESRVNTTTGLLLSGGAN